MVGLADIPIVGVFVEKVSEYTVNALFRGLKYMFCYKALVDDLNSEIGNLNIEKDKMSRKVKKEEQNGKIIEDYVLKWQNDVEEIQKSDQDFSPSCSCIQRLPIPNPVSRFHIGRNAAKKVKTVADLKGSGKDYLTGEIAYLPPLINMPKSDTAFEEFQSRKDAYKKLWDALVSEDSPLIHGIYGMAGVGKTRIMEQFWEEAVNKKIFDKVVRVNVGSEKFDNIKLQDQVAGRLDCKLELQDVESRASQLENSLRNEGKVLLILDDVWTEIRLNNIIGASFGDGNSSSKGSKILLTSRDKDVCLYNKCEHLVEIKTLSPDEALYLFKNAVGPDTINSLQDEPLVQNICNECGHLPLLIHAIGKALKGKRRTSWTDAHNQLMEGKFEKIVGVDPQVYTGIKLSIDYLQNDDAKSCLFLCSMFPEDANIDLKMLIQLATGSQLIPDGESRVLAMVDYLKVSSLLLDSGEADETKVHDIIRDVARSIAFTDSKYAFIQVTCTSRYLPSSANYSTRRFLRLDAETDNVHFDEHLVCPDLRTLWLQSNDHPQQFSGGFFSMFANLCCLMLQEVKISLEHFSLQPLGNLGTLSFLQCDMSKTDGRLFPKSLKTLCICKCELPRPLDIANLTYLRKLEIQQAGPVLVMENVISSLSSLEELHISNGFINNYEKYHLNTILLEISKLTRLTSLHFEFFKDDFKYSKDEDDTFQGTDIFSNIDRYKIFVGRQQHKFPDMRRWNVPLTRLINFSGNHLKPWEGLMARAEEVDLIESDVEMSSIYNGHTRAFEDLKRLDIYKCHKMGHLASISDEIQYSVHSATSFSKLTILKIADCKLKYLFCNNIAKSLVQLQELNVFGCDSMEAIIMNEGTSDGEIINLSKLKSLKMDRLFGLRSFYVENSKNSDYPSAQYEPLFNGTVAFPSLEKLSIDRLFKINVIWGKDCYDDTVSSFCQLNDLDISWCEKLETVIPHGMLHRLQNLERINVYLCNSLRAIFPPSVVAGGLLKHLKRLTVSSCGEIKEIIEAGEPVISTDVILFPELTNLWLDWLPKLKSFGCYQTGIANTCKVPLGLPRLSSIVVKHLPDLESFFDDENFEFHLPALKKVLVDTCRFSTLFTFSMFRMFRLETLGVKNCEFLVNIVEDLRDDEICDQIITFSELTKVDLANLPNLKGFFHNANYEFHMPALKEVNVNSCRFSTLFTLSKFRKLQLEELQVSDCELLENIVEDSRVVDETCDKIITLSQLTAVALANLPNLKNFLHDANFESHMPALKEVKVYNCGISTLFTFSMFRKLQLENLLVSDCKFLENIVEDLRVDETCEKIITLFRLKEVALEKLPNLKSFFHNANYELHMPVVKKVRVLDCRLSNTLFTRSVFKNLKQLEELSVCDCELLEGIFQDARGDETLDIGDKIITLNRVSTVHLQGLPKFKSIFYSATYQCYMPALKNVKIVGCGLSTLFTCSLFREIQQLKELHVSNCELLEHIVEEVGVGGDETCEIDGKSITCSQLSSITLESLPNLKSFSCTESYVFNIPKLIKFWLIKCPRIGYFSSPEPITSLVHVTSDWCSQVGFQDLNDFITQNNNRRSYLSDCAGESSHIQDLGTQSKRIEEENSQETVTD